MIEFLIFAISYCLFLLMLPALVAVGAFVIRRVQLNRWVDECALVRLQEKMDAYHIDRQSQAQIHTIFLGNLALVKREVRNGYDEDWSLNLHLEHLLLAFRFEHTPYVQKSLPYMQQVPA